MAHSQRTNKIEDDSCAISEFYYLLQINKLNNTQRQTFLKSKTAQYTKLQIIFYETAYHLYNKCVVANLEPQLQAFCLKTWNSRNCFREVDRYDRPKPRERESENDKER
jgi:hypothetical protein